jgi:hypothetical protein
VASQALDEQADKGREPQGHKDGEQKGKKQDLQKMQYDATNDDR